MLYCNMSGQLKFLKMRTIRNWLRRLATPVPAHFLTNDKKRQSLCPIPPTHDSTGSHALRLRNVLHLARSFHPRSAMVRCSISPIPSFENVPCHENPRLLRFFSFFNSRKCPLSRVTEGCVNTANMRLDNDTGDPGQGVGALPKRPQVMRRVRRAVLKKVPGTPTQGGTKNPPGGPRRGY